ncbi:hypothetical protein [Amycolatopsis sp. FDAARGOS 1241]|uniref:hypothetical protein n=1 Tax=Amycolatopsis sp. FDAARGOS 1241 TaxID=2778070 RepID=UPI001951C466|nr:hypothetical protein [Amycolatopsis sp. FDAARGOS 1241]QRP43073.1 hypothetical protein I6J71_26985 [Amycolatopsis sp. FDAARGOS 1241]
MYARCAFALKADPNVAGAESLFDAALSNGLAVVVGSSWRGEEFYPQKPNRPSKPRVRSAGDMLTLLATKATDKETTSAEPKLASP